jgi:hypothetical protein
LDPLTLYLIGLAVWAVVWWARRTVDEEYDGKLKLQLYYGEPNEIRLWWTVRWVCYPLILVGVAIKIVLRIMFVG